MSGIKNIARGHQYEEEALQYFAKVSKSSASTCGFFLHPFNNRFGASPDGLGPAGILVEIKTRAENAQGPIEDLKNFPNYYTQCQLQMACTDAHTCILLSYHPESKTGNCFAVKRNDILINILIDICLCILNNEPLLHWYTGDEDLDKLGDQLVGKSPLTFEVLKHLRTYIKTLSHEVPILKFIDEIDFEI